MKQEQRGCEQVGKLWLSQGTFWGSNEDGGSQEGQDVSFAPSEGSAVLGRMRWVCISWLAAASLCRSMCGLQLVIRELLKWLEK